MYGLGCRVKGGCGVWSVECGVRSVECGVWIVVSPGRESERAREREWGDGGAPGASSGARRSLPPRAASDPAREGSIGIVVRILEKLTAFVGELTFRNGSILPGNTLQRFKDLYLEAQGQNLALTVFCVPPYWLGAESRVEGGSAPECASCPRRPPPGGVAAPCLSV